MNFNQASLALILIVLICYMIYSMGSKFSLKDIKVAVIDFVETLIVATLVLFSVYATFAFPVEVSGASMQPNLETGDRLLVEKVTKYFDGYSRGEIIVLHPPDSDYIDYVKRIIGVPGDTIKIYNCQVFITRNDTKFVLNEEAYLDSKSCTLGGKSIVEGRIYTLKDTEYLVLGDNRGNSQDSRFFGILNEDRIQGKVVARFWPPAKVKLY